MFSSDRPHRTEIRVRYAETDQARVAYHANYLQWFEVGRTELMRELGFPYGAFEDERDILLTVVETLLRYLKPARYDELIRIETWVSEVRKVRFRLDHRLYRVADGELISTGYLWLASVTREGKTVSLPADLRAAIESK